MPTRALRPYGLRRRSGEMCVRSVVLRKLALSLYLRGFRLRCKVGAGEEGCNDEVH